MDELYEEVNVESFWGAIACFFLLQIFGYVIFQTFLVSLDSWFTVLLGGVFLCGFIFFQSESFYKIINYILKNRINLIIESLHEIDELMKFCLTIIFIVIFIFFNSGYYPLPKQDYDLFILILFYVFSWFVSFIISRLNRHNSSIRITTGANRLIGIIMGFVFFIIAFFNESIPLFNIIPEFQKFSLFLGTLGLGMCMLLISSLLIEDQIKHVEVK